MEQNGSLRAAGCDEAGVRQSVGIVDRPDIDKPRLLQSGREFKFHLSVATASRDVALRAVGVEIRASPAIQFLLRFIRVHEPRIFVRSYREE